MSDSSDTSGAITHVGKVRRFDDAGVQCQLAECSCGWESHLTSLRPRAYDLLLDHLSGVLTTVMAEGGAASIDTFYEGETT